MEKDRTLYDLSEGQWAKVTSLIAKGSIRRRLQELGIIQGTSIECVSRSPSGDPMAFFIRGATIALRSEDSKTIIVSAQN